MADTADTVDGPWRRASATREVMAALQAGGGEARVVGGCVRDALVDPARDIADIDIATVEPPERVQALLADAGIRTIATGLAHGTVTALAGERRFEVTTLRRDVACDGRHAEVSFTRSFVEDAARRDFTINAMSAGADGTLFDYFDGRADLARGLVRFVGEARARVREDYLRILRYFRFHGRFGREVDAAALDACTAERAGLAILSGERVQSELFKLLTNPRVLEALALMRASGVFDELLGLPADLDALRQLLSLHDGADPLLRLAALLRRGGDEATTARLAERLKLSSADQARLQRLLRAALPEAEAGAADDRLSLYRHGRDAFLDALALAAALDGWSATAFEARRQRAMALEEPRFPLRGKDVLDLGVRPGPQVGRLLEEIEAWWIDADFTHDREACLRELRARSPDATASPARHP